MGWVSVWKRECKRAQPWEADFPLQTFRLYLTSLYKELKSFPFCQRRLLCQIPLPETQLHVRRRRWMGWGQAAPTPLPFQAPVAGWAAVALSLCPAFIFRCPHPRVPLQPLLPLQSRRAP